MKKTFLLTVLLLSLLLLTGCKKDDEKVIVDDKKDKTNDVSKPNENENDNANINNLDKLVCHYVDEENANQDIILYSKNKIVKFMEVSTTMAVPSEQIDMTISMGNAMKDSFKESMGMDIEYTKLSDTTVKFTGTFDLSKLMESDIMKTTMSEYIDASLFESLDKDELLKAMTVDLLKASLPSGTVCDEQN